MQTSKEKLRAWMFLARYDKDRYGPMLSSLQNKLCEWKECISCDQEGCLHALEQVATQSGGKHQQHIL